MYVLITIFIQYIENVIFNSKIKLSFYKIDFMFCSYKIIFILGQLKLINVFTLMRLHFT